MRCRGCQYALLTSEKNSCRNLADIMDNILMINRKITPRNLEFLYCKKLQSKWRKHSQSHTTVKSAITLPDTKAVDTIIGATVFTLSHTKATTLTCLQCWANLHAHTSIHTLTKTPQMNRKKVLQWLPSCLFILSEDFIQAQAKRWCHKTLIARFMGPIWGPSGADRTQVGPMLAPWTLLSGEFFNQYWLIVNSIYRNTFQWNFNQIQ